MFKSPAGAVLFLLLASQAAGSVRAACAGPGPAGPGRRDTIQEGHPGDSVRERTGPAQQGMRKELENPTYNRMLDRAIRYQEKADSLARVAVAWRKEAGEMIDPLLRGKLQERIEQLEDSVAMYSMLADEHFSYLLNSLPEEAEAESRHPYLVRDTVLNGITVYRYDLTDAFRARLDTIRGGEVRGPVREAAKSEEKKEVSRPREQGPKHSSPAGFRVLDASPYGPGNPIEMDFKIPPGVFYRIQLAVYSKAVEPGHFGGLAPIMAEEIPGRNLTRYYVGKFTRMEEARKALNRVRSLGYRDAFIIGYYNGQKSSFSKLKALEE